MNISRKTEKAIKWYLSRELNIPDLHFYECHEKIDKIAFPNLVICAESSSQHPDMPTETGIRVVTIRCKFTIDSDEHTRDVVDDWKSQLDVAMTEDREAMQAVLNRPVRGPDTRPVQKIHFHDFVLTDDPSDRNEMDWIEDSLFEITAEPLDS